MDTPKDNAYAIIKFPDNEIISCVSEEWEAWAAVKYLQEWYPNNKYYVRWIGWDS